MHAIHGLCDVIVPVAVMNLSKKQTARYCICFAIIDECPDATPILSQTHARRRILPSDAYSCRVLYGEIEIQAYDWVKANERSKEYGDPKPAKLSVERSVKVA